MLPYFYWGWEYEGGTKIEITICTYIGKLFIHKELKEKIREVLIHEMRKKCKKIQR